MPRRKIQLIAGTTYSISLPKEWVIKNRLKEQDEILITEKYDKTLIISPVTQKQLSSSEISINLEKYPNAIEHIIFVIYYLGYEVINILSSTPISKELRSRIRKTILEMSGTEISFEDENIITAKVLIDKSKVDVLQILYRMSLLIDTNLSLVMDKKQMAEMTINEEELDRLYRLIFKIISISLTNSNILLSSGIVNISHIPSYFLINKRLENIGDNAYRMAEYLLTSKRKVSRLMDIINFVRTEIKRSIKYLIGNRVEPFKKTLKEDIDLINQTVAKIRDKRILVNVKDIIRYLINIQEEIVNISFIEQLEIL